MANFHRIIFHPARGSTPVQMQYWIRTEDVLAGRPGEAHVPPGHWPKLVQLAQDVGGAREVSPATEVRILTAWYAGDQEKVEVKVEADLPELE